jgi:hypothetical protein
MIFLEFPDAERIINKSPELAELCNCREKTWSYPKSLPIAVIRLVLSQRLMAFTDSPTEFVQRFKSVAKWLAVAALPPLPIIQILQFDSIASRRRSTTPFNDSEFTLSKEANIRAT